MGGLLVAGTPPRHRAAARRSDNAFALVRLLGVLLVLVHHSWGLAAPGTNLFGEASGTDPGTLGVAMFFAASGYLVTGSWLADPHPVRFVARRVLRLIPALAVVVTATALVVGPLLTDLPRRAYLAEPATWGYLTNAGLWRLQWSLPGVLGESGVNGSLWTLPWEAKCYLAVLALGALTVLSRPLLVAAIGASALLWFALDAPDPAYLASAVVAFTLGVAGHHVCALRLPPCWTAPVAAAMWIGSWGTRFAPAASVLFAVTAVFVIAFHTPARFAHPTGTWDLSYGMYLTAYPIQMIAILEGGVASPWVVLLITVVGSGGLACLLWPLVERPALRLKPRGRQSQVLLDAGGCRVQADVLDAVPDCRRRWASGV